MRRAFLSGVMAMWAVSLWAEGGTLNPPAPRSLRGLSPAEQEAAQKADRADRDAWKAQLSDEQKEVWTREVEGESKRWRERQKNPDVWREDDWRAQAELLGFTAEDVTRLERDGLFIEDRQLKQCFEGYTKPRGPVFVTSDVMLNVFQSLFEESFRALELRRVSDLRMALEGLIARGRKELASDQNDFPLDQLRPSWELAQRVVGPAVVLLGGDVNLFDEPVRADIAAEVARIRAADTLALPAWWGKPTAELVEIDYRRMKPVGFYAENAQLAELFRAVRWLQSVPLRADRDDQLGAIALLGFFSQADRGEMLGRYGDLLGRADDRGLSEAQYDFQNVLSGRAKGPSAWAAKVVNLRREMLGRVLPQEEWGKLNDDRRYPPEVEEALAEVSYRVLPAYRLPESLALKSDGEPGRLPRGLVVAALVGSDFAKRQLVDFDPTVLEEAEAEWHPGPRNGRRAPRPSFYDDYLETLATLAAPPEPEAPDFVRGEAWAAKSCQTIMAGWAQMRHAATLQAKESVLYFGMTMLPPGFVEPNPEFFGHFADLVGRASGVFSQAGAFAPSALAETAALREQAKALEAFGFQRPEARREDLKALPREERRKLDQLIQAADALDEIEGGLWSVGKGTDEVFQQFFVAKIERLRAAADEIEAGTRAVPARGAELRSRMESLGDIARRLEAMAHKQLRGRDWSDAEAEFLRNFGETIAGLMGYEGNSWLTPRDDAPRWATVASDPVTDTMLAVAVGRARPIHVLYPWHGHDVLCHGAVMPYYEYAARERLTDGEWKALLDSGATPKMPEWIEPIVAR